MIPKISRKPFIWTFTTYFAEGFPYAIIRTVSSVFFRDRGVSLEAIGLTPMFGIPWILKFLWAPHVDETSTKRRWMVTMQALLLGIFTLAALVTPLSVSVRLVAGLFFVGSIFAATQDIAIDGYYMEALNKDDQARFVGYRVMAFRIAWMIGAGVIVTIGTNFNWSLAFFSAAAIFGLIFIYHLFFLREVQEIRKPFHHLLRSGLKPRALAILTGIILLILSLRWLLQSTIISELQRQLPFLAKIRFPHLVAVLLLIALALFGLLRKRIQKRLVRNPDSFYTKAYMVFMERRKIGLILFFVIFLRTGEWTLATMVAPFIVDLGIKVHYGWISGLVGLPAGIFGAMIGGWMISRYSLKKLMWPFILAQNVSNLVYMAIAIHLSSFIQANTGADNPLALGTFNLALVGAVHGFDQFASGLGNAVLMTYLMRICHEKYKAAHYAIGSGLMNVSGLFAGVMSGFIAGWLGYAWLFGLSFLVSIPAMVVIPLLPYLDE